MGPKWSKPCFFEFWPLGACLGPILALLAALRAPRPPLGFSGPPRDRPWSLLGGPGQPPGGLLAALGPPWGRPWPAPELSWAVLGASGASPGPPFGALGPLLAAKAEFSRKLVKTIVFPWFSQVFRSSWSPPGASWGPPGTLLGRPRRSLGPLWASWVALGRSWAGSSGHWGPPGRPWPRPWPRPWGASVAAHLRRLRDPQAFYCIDWFVLLLRNERRCL